MRSSINDEERSNMRQILTTTVLFWATCFASIAHASSGGDGPVSLNPSPSPSGAEVVFEADFDGSMNLWIAGLRGQNLRKLTNGSGDMDAAWSPKGDIIAFASRGPTTTDIWTVRADGSQLTQLTSQALNNSRPAWSPDARQIVFVSDRGGTNDIWIMNADGTSQRRVTNLPGEENRPSFSPAGDRIVFSETVSNFATLMSIKTEGSGLISVTQSGFNDWNPQWSAGSIVFASNRDQSGHWKIWHVNPDGTGLARLGDIVGLDPVLLSNGHVIFSDEFSHTGTVASITDLDPISGTKTLVADVRGHFKPIDVRPTTTTNRINATSHGEVSVAILSQAGFDATTQVDQSTLTFGHAGDETSFVRCEKKNFKDINKDGLPDLVCRFNIRSAAFQPGDTVAILRFSDVDGAPFEGRDAVAIGPFDDGDDDTDD